ncbi:MAG: hypothetical protein ACFFBW_04985 [Promethearchaeota archaeon]
MRKLSLKKNLFLIILIFMMAFIFYGFLKGNQISTKISIEEDSLKSSRIIAHPNNSWIKNPTFDDPIEPTWFSNIQGDFSDVSASTSPGQANFEILGDSQTFSEISGTPQAGDWIEFNHSVRPLPLTHEINQYGCNVSHVYDEDSSGPFPNSGDQTANLAGVLWKRNVTMPVDMSDYIITSASINAVVNGSADTDIETPNDHPPFAEGGYASLFDYTRFYVEISDLNNLESYEIAYNKTLNLGEGYADRRDYDFSTRNYMSDTNMTKVDEDVLIFSLTQVLKHDNYNFTITLGIEVDSEDNYPGYELDVWYSLLIKSCDLSFTYEKKMDRSTSVSWNQVGNKISGSNVQITDGNLKFKYNISNSWPTSLSPNSEIRIIINDNQHSETIKLSTASSSFQEANIEGFDVTSLILINVNITLSIQVFLADEFRLAQNLTVSIDDVQLIISYTEEIIPPRIEPWIATGLFIIALFAATILTGYLIAYQLYLKYPIPVRKVRKFSKTLHKEKEPDVKIISRDKAFNQSFRKEMHKTNRYLKGTPIDGKILREKLLSNQENNILQK